jgi:hypothetical protein
VTLEELLDELREGILNDRSDREAGTSDYLWSDERLIRYIDEAQRRDSSTAEVCEIELVEGQSEYPLHESVIAVMSVRRDGYAADLPRTGHSILNAYRQPAEDWADTSYYTSMPPGVPYVWSTDEGVSNQLQDSMQQVILRVYPEPSADQEGDILKLRVVRKPLDRLTSASLSAVPEVPEDHHIEMLDWAAYLALRIVDDDAGAPRRAAEFAASFDVHVKNARKLAMRKMFTPAPWGFGRGGFTWGS